MADEIPNQNIVQGNVGKLTTIGTVNGNVLIINEKSTKEALNKIHRFSMAQTQFPVIDVANYIKITVKSKRFGRQIQFQVPHTMTVSAFTDLVVEVLQLPSSKSIDEFMISLNFQYSIIFKEIKLPPTQNLQDAGIQNNSEVELNIATEWIDKIQRTEQVGKINDTAYVGGGIFGLLLGSRNEGGIRKRTLSPKEKKVIEIRGTISQERLITWTTQLLKYVDDIGNIIE